VAGTRLPAIDPCHRFDLDCASCVVGPIRCKFGVQFRGNGTICLSPKSLFPWRTRIVVGPRATCPTIFTTTTPLPSPPSTTSQPPPTSTAPTPSASSPSLWLTCGLPVSGNLIITHDSNKILNVFFIFIFSSRPHHHRPGVGLPSPCLSSRLWSCATTGHPQSILFWQVRGFFF